MRLSKVWLIPLIPSFFIASLQAWRWTGMHWFRSKVLSLSRNEIALAWFQLRHSLRPKCWGYFALGWLILFKSISRARLGWSFQIQLLFLNCHNEFIDVVLVKREILPYCGSQLSCYFIDCYYIWFFFWLLALSSFKRTRVHRSAWCIMSYCVPACVVSRFEISTRCRAFSKGRTASLLRRVPSDPQCRSYSVI